MKETYLKPKSSRISKSFTIILLLFSIVLSNFSPLLSNSAYAAKSYGNQDLDTKYLMYEYGRIVDRCYSGDAAVEPNRDRVASGQLFGYSGVKVRTYSPVVASEISDVGDDYILNCNWSDGEPTKKAFASWGITTQAERLKFICDMGYARNNDVDCIAGVDQDFKGWGNENDVNKRMSNFTSTLKSYTGVDVNNPANEIRYLRYRDVLLHGCTTNIPVTGTYTGSADRKFSLKTISENGEEVTEIYSGTQKRTDKPKSWSGETSCATIEGYVDDYYQAYATAKLSEAAADLCNSHEPAFSTAVLSACKDGVLNKNNSSHNCTTSWADSASVGDRKPHRDACEWGKGQEIKVEDPLQISLGNNSEEPPSTCGIDGIGWVVCPVIAFLAGVTDMAYNFLADTFLVMRPDVLAGAETAWSTMRNIANVAFVIVFLMIIFSQLTSYGIGNYGVKRMLPKILIAAILVNISFFVCQLAVDVSNILGKSVYDVFGTIASSSHDTAGSGQGADLVGGWTTILVGAGGILAAGIGLSLAISVPVLLAALLAVLMIVLILLLRIALIVLLTVVSPLAFVAYLLPNTEHWFKKWAKTYGSLLMVYPIIGAVFGAGTLAATILASQSDMVMKVMAMGVAVVPFFVVPSLLKGSLNAVGTLGTKMSGLSSKANSRIGAKSRETSMLSAMNRTRQQGAAMRRAKAQGKMARFIPGRTGRRMEATGVAAAENIRTEQIKEAEQQISSLGLTQDQRHELAMGRSVKTSSGRTISGKGNMREAAVKMQGQTGNHDQIMEMVDARMGGDLSKTLATSLATRSDKPAWLGASALERVSRADSSVTSEGLIAEAVNNNAYSAERISTADKDELLAVSKVASTSPAVPPASRTQIRDNAISALTDPILSTKISKNKPGVDAISVI